MKLTDSPFQKGLFMKVPKGTELQIPWCYDHINSNSKTSRDVIVEISSVQIPQHSIFLTPEETAEQERLLEAIPQANHDLYQRLPKHIVSYPGRSPGSATYDREELTPEAKQEYDKACHAGYREQNRIHAHYQAIAEARITADDLLVGWSNNSKWALAKDVELAEKPEVRKKQPKVNLRQQMVPKSRWKVTKDTDIIYGAPNPAYHAAIDAWDKANPRPNNYQGNTAAQRTAWDAAYKTWHQGFEANRDAAEKAHGKYLPTVYAGLKAGDIFTVIGKFISYWHPYGWDGEHYTNVAPCLLDGETNEVGLEYSMIKDVIEVESIPVVKSFVLRHRSTGQYYKSSNYDEPRSAEHVETFMKGKKWDNIGKAKTSILIMTGYYEGLPGADEALPEWGGAISMSAEQLREYDLVEFNKLDRAEVGVVADFQEWFDRSWQLRELTMKYGSSVRTVYKALEKAKMLETQSGVAVFTVTDQNALDKVSYWGDRTALTDDDKEEIKRALISVKGKFKHAIDHKSAAVSFPNKGAAMMFKLAYNGNLKVSVIDLNDMKEAVGD